MKMILTPPTQKVHGILKVDAQNLIVSNEQTKKCKVITSLLNHINYCYLLNFCLLLTC